MDSAELLSQLADIHLPGPVTIWPPAPGWWLLALLLLAGLWFGGRRLLALWRRRRYCQHALLELEGIFDQFAAADANQADSARLRYVNAFNSVLRRVALTHFPDAAVAGLGGEDWIGFLRANGDCLSLDQELAEALSHGRFQPAIAVDTDKLHSFGREWIRSMYLQRTARHKPRKHQNSQQNQAAPGLEAARSDA